MLIGESRLYEIFTKGGMESSPLPSLARSKAQIVRVIFDLGVTLGEMFDNGIETWRWELLTML